MASNNTNIRAAIINKLRSMSTIKVVYDSESVPTDGKYPYASVAMESGDAKFGDSIRNIRTNRFTINIYQERTQVGFGNSKAENVVALICDEVETAFDNDTTLSGTCKWVKPLKLNTNYVSGLVGEVRVAQYIVEAVSVVPSIT